MLRLVGVAGGSAAAFLGGGEVEGDAGAGAVLVAEGGLEGEGEALVKQLGVSDRDALGEREGMGRGEWI